MPVKLTASAVASFRQRLSISPKSVKDPFLVREVDQLHELCEEWLTECDILEVIEHGTQLLARDASREVVEGTAWMTQDTAAKSIFRAATIAVTRPRAIARLLEQLDAHYRPVGCRSWLMPLESYAAELLFEAAIQRCPLAEVIIRATTAAQNAAQKTNVISLSSPEPPGSAAKKTSPSGPPFNGAMR